MPAMDVSDNGELDADCFSFHLAVASKIRLTVVQHDPDSLPAPGFKLLVLEGVDCAAQTTRFAATFATCPFVSDPVALPAGDHVAVATLDGARSTPYQVSYKLAIEVTQELPVKCEEATGSRCRKPPTRRCAKSSWRRRAVSPRVRSSSTRRSGPAVASWRSW